MIINNSSQYFYINCSTMDLIYQYLGPIKLYLSKFYSFKLNINNVFIDVTYQSCTALKDSSFVTSYMSIKPIAPL